MVFPVNVNVVAVSTEVNPVTQTAEVEVKKASVILIPLAVADGKSKSREPIMIIIIKLARKRRDGLIPLRKARLFFENSIKNTKLFTVRRYSVSAKLYHVPSF